MCLFENQLHILCIRLEPKPNKYYLDYVGISFFRKSIVVAKLALLLSSKLDHYKVHTEGVLSPKVLRESIHEVYFLLLADYPRRVLCKRNQLLDKALLIMVKFKMMRKGGGE